MVRHERSSLEAGDQRIERAFHRIVRLCAVEGDLGAFGTYDEARRRPGYACIDPVEIIGFDDGFRLTAAEACIECCFIESDICGDDRSCA